MNPTENAGIEFNNESADEVFKSFEEYFAEKYKNGFFEAFKGYFDDRTDFDAFIEKLKEEDKNKILRLGFFYSVITKFINHAGVTLVGIFSLMEATSDIKYKTFDQWLLKKIKKDENISFPIVDNNCLKQAILLFQKEYFKEHGSAEKVRNFISQYYSTEDKKRIIRAFEIKDETIKFDSLNFDEQLTVIVDMLYKERSAFVHEGRLPQMSEERITTIASFEIKGKYRNVVMEISINDIQKMFEKAFIKFINSMRVKT